MAPFMDALAEEVLLKEDGPPALGLVYHLAGTPICCGPHMHFLLQLEGGFHRRVAGLCVLEAVVGTLYSHATCAQLLCRLLHAGAAGSGR